jgi:uncharacterized protein
MVSQQPQISTEPLSIDQHSIDRLIVEVTNRLVEQFNPEKIFLFGSYVWGKPNIDSDLDLLVIVSDSNISSSKRASIAYRCLRDIKYPLDILVKTHQEIEKFSQVPLSLEHKILAQGKCLHG